MDYGFFHFMMSFFISNIMILLLMTYLGFEDFKHKEVPSKFLYLSCFLSLLVHFGFFYQLGTEHYLDLFSHSVIGFLLFLSIEKSVYIVNLFSDKYKGTSGFLGDGDKYFVFTSLSFITFITLFIGSFFNTGIITANLKTYLVGLVIMSSLSIIQFYLFEKNKEERKVSLFPSIYFTSLILIGLIQLNIF